MHRPLPITTGYILMKTTIMLIYKEMKGNFILNNSFKLFMINKWIWIIIIKSTNKVDLSKFLETYYP